MFLATTALEDFWDKDKKILFLGEGCKLYDRKEEWGKLDYIDFGFHWDKVKTKEACLYCDQVYEKFLTELTKELNQVHNLNKDKQYYRIILGNWLLHFIHQLYDKYSVLKAATSQYPDLETIVLDSRQHYVPFEYNSFIDKLVKDDRYNLQMYSQVLSFINANFGSKKLQEPIAQEKFHYFNPRLSDKFHSSVSRFQTFVNSGRKNNLTITQPYFSYHPRRKAYHLFFKRIFKYIRDDMRYGVRVSAPIDLSLRSRLRSKVEFNEFETILSELIAKNIPLLFLEGFAEFRKKALSLPIKKPKAVFTAIALHSNFIFKFFVAEYRNDIRVLNIQHGGGYMVDEHYVLEDYEKSVSDTFYMWGKGSDDSAKYLAHAKLYKCSRSAKTKNVFFVLNTYPRYLYRFFFHPASSSVLRYIDHSIRFFKKSKPDINFLLRLHPVESDYKWATKKRMLDSGVSFKFDKYVDKYFNKRLENCYIYATDNLSTSYLESLAINKPTIIFLDPDIIHLRDSAKGSFEALEQAGILHYSPESAAEHLNKVYDDVDRWWRDENVQKVRGEFVNRYASISNNWTKEWTEEFDRVLAGSQR